MIKTGSTKNGGIGAEMAFRSMAILQEELEMKRRLQKGSDDEVSLIEKECSY